ncbi:MAG: hypothetical protein RBT25_01350 [Lentisphaeria bacterium]|nr:hypothetical protein [Lentisphaeria bacterium]
MKTRTQKTIAIFLGLALLLVLGVSRSHAALTDNDSHNVVITINECALLALNSNQNTTFTIDIVEDGEAGDSIAVVGGENLNNNYLHYTSIVDGTGKTRKITVQIDGADNIPAGTTLTVSPGAPAATGQGDKGTAASTAIDLSTAAGATNAKDLVSGIKSCSTGNGSADGVQLTYALAIDNQTTAVAALVADEYTVEVTYTLTAAQ